MQSIGELFVSLGFDVDDAKLKQFNENIKNGFEGMLKMSAAAAGAATALNLLISNAADRSVALANFNVQTGQSVEGLQKFAAVVQQTNPAETFESGLAAAKALNNYLTEASTGQRSATELNMLGVNYVAGMTNDEVITRMQKTLPDILKRWGPRITSQWLASVFGDAGVMQALLTTPEQYDRLGEAGVTSQQKRDDLHKYAEAVKELDVSWQHFETTLGSELAGPAATAIGWITKLIDVIDRLDKAVPGAASHVGALGAGTLAAIGGGTAAKMAGTIPVAGDFLGGILSTLSGLGGVVALASIPWAASDIGHGIGDYLKKNDSVYSSRTSKALDYFTSQGWTQQQAQGMIARLMKESGLMPDKVGDGGQAYGIAQWHPDRQQAFKAFAGHDIHQSTLDEQLAFMNYELTQGNEQRAGRMLRQTSSIAGAEGITAGFYERPAVTQNITMHITGGNAEEIGDEVTRRVIQQQHNAAYSQRDLGPKH